MIIERASMLAYCAPSLVTVSASVARATEGAAPNNPAKLFGLNKSPRRAKNETVKPPIRNRMRISSIEALPGDVVPILLDERNVEFVVREIRAVDCANYSERRIIKVCYRSL